MDSLIIYKVLDPQPHLPLQVINLIFLFLHLQPKMMQQLSIQLLQLSVFNRSLFVNAMGELYTILMPALSVSLTSSQKIIIKRMKQSNILHGDYPTELTRECNSQPPVAHFKSNIFPPKTSPVVLAIMGRLTHSTIYNGNVEIYPSYFPVEYTY